MYRDLLSSATLVIAALVAGLATPVVAQIAVDAAVDTDGDGLTDDEETIIGTSPIQSDTDGQHVT